MECTKPSWPFISIGKIIMNQWMELSSSRTHSLCGSIVHCYPGFQPHPNRWCHYRMISNMQYSSPFYNCPQSNVASREIQNSWRFLAWKSHLMNAGGFSSKISKLSCCHRSHQNILWISHVMLNSIVIIVQGVQFVQCRKAGEWVVRWLNGDSMEHPWTSWLSLNLDREIRSKIMCIYNWL